MRGVRGEIGRYGEKRGRGRKRLRGKRSRERETRERLKKRREPEKWERLERGRLGTHGDENGEGGEERAMTRGSTRGVVWSARICGFASVRTEKEAEIVLDLSVI
ncbi:hypothetical protein Tco_0696022 [Tanacetum coccineum]